jgi:hypothetical protein
MKSRKCECLDIQYLRLQYDWKKSSFANLIDNLNIISDGHAFIAWFNDFFSCQRSFKVDTSETIENSIELNAKIVV